MQTQKTGLDFKGQNIFVGIDVHLKSWAVTILTENLVHKTFTQPASADTLLNYLERNFPGGDYYSVYEAGFSGFWTTPRLQRGVSCCEFVTPSLKNGLSSAINFSCLNFPHSRS